MHGPEASAPETANGAASPEAGGRANGHAARPLIQIVLGHPEDAIAAATHALGSDPDLYVRDTDLVHVTRATDADQTESAWTDVQGRERFEVIAGTPRIHTMTLATLRVRMCVWASWERAKPTKEGFEWVRCEPTRQMAEEVRDERRWPGLRILNGIAEAPFLRPDGTVVQGEPRYDAMTGYLYEPSRRFPLVPLMPTIEDARRSYAALLDLFVDFPFAHVAGAAACVAALLTLVARPAIRGPTPAWVLDATTPGTGKSLLADVIAAVVFGRESGRAHFPAVEGRDGDAELQKRLGFIAREGRPMVNFDNADDAMIGGDVLEECISCRDTYTFRILGKTEGLTVPMRIVFFFTANNATWSRGMNRRIEHVRLESPLPDPEHRPLDTYVHPERAGRLFEYAIEHRAEYIVHALIVLRAHAAAGYPDKLALGTFESWAGIVPSAIVYAGGQNAMLCRPSQSGEDSPDTMQRQELVRQWSAFLRASTLASMSAHDMIERLYPERNHGEPLDKTWDALRGAIEYFVPCKPGQAPDARKLGDVIGRRFKGSPVKIDPAPALPCAFLLDGHSGGRARWRVEAIAGYPRRPLEDDPDERAAMMEEA